MKPKKKFKMISVSEDLKLKLDKEMIKSGMKMSYSQLLEYLIEKNK